MNELRHARDGDPSEDGHPIEVALAFRLAVIRSDIASEIPADVLDLAVQFAWIGKAVSRTTGINQWFLSGIDPNTRQIVSAMAVDSTARQTALSHAVSGEAAPYMADSLKAVRTCQAFGHAVKVVSGLCSFTPPRADVERLAILCGLAQRVADTKRLERPRQAAGVVSFEAFRRLRKAAEP